MPRAPRGVTIWLVFIGLALVWGSSFLFIKLGLEEGLGPVTLVVFRLWIGAATLLVLFRLTGSRLPAERSDLLRIMAVSFINIAAPFTLITWAELHIDSAMASILNGLVPLFAIVIAAVALQDEPITVNRLVGLLIGFCGAFLLLSRNLGPTPAADAQLALIGQLAVVLACVFYATSAVVMRKWFSGRKLVNDPQRGPRSLGPVELALPQVATAAVVMTIVAVLIQLTGPVTAPVPTTTLAWFSVAWLGMLGSAVAYLLYFRLLDAWGATRSTLVTYAMPIVGLILGVIVLGETIDAQVIAGTALIIGGIALVSSKVGQRRLYGRRSATASSSD